MEALAPAVRNITDRLLAAFSEPGRHDLMAEVAFPLPIAVISEMLGVPADDRDAFARWSHIMVDGAARRAELPGAQANLIAYIRELLAAKRKHPASDLISMLVADGGDGNGLTENELVSAVYLLLLAGHDTTAGLIGSGAYRMLDDPARWELLRSWPELLPAAIEEMLRYDSPVQLSTHRVAAEDVTYGGHLIPAGSTVLISLLSANRDARRFEDADAFDPTRPGMSHLAFGHGIHHCLGAPLARLEARVVFEALLTGRPALTLADDFVPRWRPSILMHSLAELPVVIQPDPSWPRTHVHE